MNPRYPGQPDELKLAPESIEALARRLAELIDTRDDRPGEQRFISAEEVAQRWNVGRRWVYEHTGELGARRLGDGPKPRLRFDAEEVAEHLGGRDRAPGPRTRRFR
jgi:hypothetical protein